MRRNTFSKLRVLSSRHPGLRDKLHGMFEEFWPLGDVKHMIESHYGEHLSVRSISRYKQHHWRAQRELVQAMSAALQEAGQSGHLYIGSPGHC